MEQGIAGSTDSRRCLSFCAVDHEMVNASHWRRRRVIKKSPLSLIQAGKAGSGEVLSSDSRADFSKVEFQQRLQQRLLCGDTIKVFIGAEEDLPIADGGRCAEFLLVGRQLVGCQFFERLRGFDHMNVATSRHVEDLAVTKNG